jgi:hypothetical protein
VVRDADVNVLCCLASEPSGRGKEKDFKTYEVSDLLQCYTVSTGK